MRIVHVYKDYYPVLGGIENHVRVLAERQVAAGHEVAVVVCALGRQGSVAVEGGVTVVRTGRLATVRSMPLSLSFKGALRDRGAEVVHVHSPFPLGEQAATGLKRDVALVVTHHADVVKQKLLLKFYTPLYKRFLRRVDRIIVTSEAYGRSSPWLQAHGDKLRAVPLGIESATFKPANGNKGDVVELLFAGKLRYYKGLDDLLEALEGLKGVRLNIVGDGPMRQKLEGQAAELKLTDRVNFLGEVADDELPGLYQRARLFVLPANCRAEAFGTVLLEAMASGLPCVSTELATGTSWVVQDGVTGMVVPPRNPAALAEAITSLLSDPERLRSMGDAGRQRVLDTFTTDKMVAGVEAVYREAQGL